jgi:tetratricopeptide (TPR) repeat protein
MSDDAALCPAPAVLRDLLLGRISAADARPLEEHLTHCARCNAVAEQLSGADPLVDELRGSPQVLADPDWAVVEDLMRDLRQLPAEASSGRLATAYIGAPGNAPPAASDDSTQDDSPLLQPPCAEESPKRLGGYELLHLLGRGGMGVVYLARQARPNRLVALKMVSAAPWDGQEQMARFRAETEVIARLQHPHIVPIYEVGDYRGRPYFTMEYIEGGSLAQQLATAPLPPRPAADLVESLARAMQFAHHHGVIHRDLKPANVLLSFSREPPASAEAALAGGSRLHDSMPKITDFGLAKQFVDNGDSPQPEYRTETGAILGTPAYMAPEQAGGRAGIGPAVDIYALGAILYECLTGRPPFKAAMLLVTLEQVRTAEPVPPGRLQPGLPRDLETICLKCLQKDPARRYPTAEALADDLARWRAGEPIRARPVSRRERFVKWVLRQPALAALLAVSVMSVLALTAGAIRYQAGLRDALAAAQRQEHRADANYHAARDAVQHMLDRLDEQGMAGTPRLKELKRKQLEDALAFYQGSLQELDTDDLAVRQDTAEAYRQTAIIQGQLGRTEPARTNALHAIDLWERLAAEQPEVAEYRGALGICYSLLGNLCDLNQAEEAERFHRQALQLREELVQQKPEDFLRQEKLAETLHNLGQANFMQRRYPESEAAYDRAIAIRQHQLRERSKDHGLQARLAEDYVNLGLLYSSTQRPDQAAAAYDQCAKLLRPLVEQHPEDESYALSLGAAYSNWGGLRRDTGHGREALELLDQAVALGDGVLRKEPQHAFGRYVVNNAYGSRARTYQALGRFAEAARDWNRLIDLQTEPKRSSYRAVRAADLIRAGNRAEGLAEARVLGAQPDLSPANVYNVACIFALAMKPAGGHGPESAHIEEYAAQAITLLRRSQAGGFFRDAENVRLLSTDSDLEPLRDRADFRHWLKEVNAIKSR